MSRLPVSCVTRQVAERRRNYTVHQPLSLASSPVNFRVLTMMVAKKICSCSVRKLDKMKTNPDTTPVLYRAMVILLLCDERGQPETLWNDSHRLLVSGREVDTFPSIIWFSQLHVNCDKERSLIRRENQIISLVPLSSACKRTDCWAMPTSPCHVAFLFYSHLQWHQQERPIVLIQICDIISVNKLRNSNFRLWNENRFKHVCFRPSLKQTTYQAQP